MAAAGSFSRRGLTLLRGVCVLVMTPLLRMSRHLRSHQLFPAHLVCGLLSVVAVATAAEQRQSYDLPRGDAATVLARFAEQSGRPILFAMDKVRGVRTNAVAGEFSAAEALDRLLAGTELVATLDRETGGIVVSRRRPAVPPGRPDSDQPKPTSPTMKNSSLLRRTTAWLVLAIAPASAQTAPANSPASGTTVTLSPFEVRSERDTGYVATNTISGTKLDTPIKEIPIAIQVVTEDLIRDLQAVTIEDATRYATGVSQPVGSSEFGAADGRFNLRGFSFASPKRNGFSTPGTIDMTNVSRIEILKGPASVLYGEATAGGIVNYLTKSPKSKPESTVQLQFGSYDFYRAQIESTGPIGKLFGGPVLYRLDASYLDRGSHINDHDQRQTFISPLVQWRPLATTQLTFQYEYLLRDGQVRSKIPIYNTVAKRFWDNLPVTDARKTLSNYNQVPRINPDGSIAAAGRPYWDALADYVDWNINNAGTANYSDARTHNFDATVEQRFTPGLTGRVAANVYEVDIDAQSGNQNRMRAGGDGPERFASRHKRGNYRRTVQGDLAGTQTFGSVKNRFLLNFEYFKENNWRTTYSRDGGATSPTISDPPKYYFFSSPYNITDIRVNGQSIPLPLGYLGFIPVPLESINTRQEIRTTAFSANDTVSFFNNRLSLLVGLRHQKSDQILRNLDRFNTVSGVRIGTGNRRTPPTVKKTVPMVGVSVQLAPWLNAYALASESFVPQFGTARDADGADFALRPIVGESFEFGAKIADADGRLSATMAVFDITNRNRSRFGGLIATGPLTGESFTIQTDAEGAKGFELDGAVRPLKDWQILVGYAYTESKIKDPLFAEPVSLIDPNSPRDVRIPGVPRHQINLLQRYAFARGPLKGAALNVGANYQGARRGSESAQEVITIPAVWLYETGVSYSTKLFGRRTELRLNVINLLDKKFVTTGPFLGDPRTYRFSIRTGF